MSNLLASFASLPVSPNPGENRLSFHTLPIVPGKPHWLAKTEQGYPCLLVVTKHGIADIPAPIRLENLSVQHGLLGTIHRENDPEHAEFTLITLRSGDISLMEVFLRFARHLATDLSENPEPRMVGLEIRRLVRMLQGLRQRGQKTIQGLWGELLLIDLARNPNEWITAWHCDPMDLHDFCLPAHRVEVKTSATRVRKHFFSHRQLCSIPDTKTTIASVFVEKIANGISVHELAACIRNRLTSDSALKLDETMIATLGADYASAADFYFDQSLAKASLRYFDLADVPKIDEILPDRIFDVTYSVLLNEADGSTTPPL